VLSFYTCSALSVPDLKLCLQTSSATVANTDIPTTEPSVPSDVDKQQTSFVSYDSLFSLYPSLRLSLPLPSGGKHLDQRSGGNVSALSVGCSSAVSDPRPAYDLAGLRMATLTRSLDPSKQICQFEIPGGGICRDASCEDLHLSRVPLGDISRSEPNGASLFP
jgi:Putative zinc-finger domain